LVDPDDEGIAIFRNVGYCLHIDTV